MGVFNDTLCYSLKHGTSFWAHMQHTQDGADREHLFFTKSKFRQAVLSKAPTLVT